MSKIPVLTTPEWECFDPEIYPPPPNRMVWCVSRYGVGRKSIFNPKFDIAWAPLPKIPASVKARQRNRGK